MKTAVLRRKSENKKAWDPLLPKPKKGHVCGQPSFKIEYHKEAAGIKTTF
jgi:hypothetical protein